MIRLDNVPTKIRNGKKIYDWTNSIGAIIEIVDDDTKESVKVPIVRYERTGGRQIYVKYMENEIPISTNHIEILKGDKIFGKYTGDFRFKIGDVINNIEIIEKKNIRNCKKYKYRCLECGEIGWVDETYLKVNDYKHHCTIPTTAPWMIPYFPGGYEEANKYTYSSNQRIYPICPYCKRQSTKSVKIGNLFQMKSFQCVCNDNISYGEKFFISFLEQQGIDYVHQYRFKEFNKFYDFYIPSLNVIVEIHGEQHYIDSIGFTGKTLEEEQENDRLKRQYALSYGISKYIVIDARKGNQDWLKDHIEKSELHKLFDCTKVDWDICNQFTIKNRIEDICRYITENPQYKIKDYMKKFHISEYTLKNYVKIGNANFDWCNIKLKNKRIKDIVIMKDNKILDIKQSCTYEDVSRFLLEKYQVDILSSEIRKVCTGKYKQYKGFVFKRIA